MNDLVYEEQKQLIKMWKDKYDEKKEENERLHSIIKEVREYIENPRNEMSVNTYQELLEILDKAGKENDIEFDVLKALNTDLDDDVEMG